MAENSGMIPKNNLLPYKKISQAPALGISLLGLNDTSSVLIRQSYLVNGNTKYHRKYSIAAFISVVKTSSNV